MKKNKKVIIIVIILLIVSVGIIGYILFNINKKSDKRENIGVIDYKVIDNVNIELLEDFYIKEENNGLNTYDYQNNKIYNYDGEYEYYQLFANKYIILFDNIKKIIDKNGNVLLSGNSLRILENDYVVVDGTIYNKELKEVYKLDNKYINNIDKINITIDDSWIVINSVNADDYKLNSIIDYKNNNVLWHGFEKLNQYYDRILNIKYYGFNIDGKGYIVDNIDKKVLYENVTYSDYNSFIYENKMYYIDNGIIYGDETNIGNNLVLSKDTCDYGYKLKKGKKIVIDKCASYYKILFDDAIVGYNVDNGKNILFYKNKELEANAFLLVGDYISEYHIGENASYTIYYDKDLNKIDVDKDLVVMYTDGNYYAYKDNDMKIYMLDKTLKKQDIDYEEIRCKYGYCILYKDTYEKYLYKDGKKVFDMPFTELDFEDEKLIGETLFKTYIFTLGNGNKKIDINTDLSINIDNIVKEYKLDDILTKINKNEELFKKYAYIVENNKDLEGYRKEVYDIFEIVVDHKEYLNEFYFLKKLSKLNIIYNESLDGSYYYDSKVSIRLLSNKNSVVYRYLLNFIYYSFNDGLLSLYDCNGKYEVSKNGNDGKCEYKDVYNTYLLDAGSEILLAKYFTKNYEYYTFKSNYLAGLEYIYGLDVFNKWYFDSKAYFTEFWYQNIDSNEVEKVIKLLDDNNINVDERMYLIDLLIDLYKENKNEDFVSDKKFIYLLKTLCESNDFSLLKYYDDLKDVVVADISNSVYFFEDNIKGYDPISIYYSFVILNNKTYLSWKTYDSKSNEGILLMDFDFNKNKINDYTFIID